MPIKYSNITTYLVLAVILLSVSVSYHNAISNGFTSDDIDLVLKNNLISDWSNLKAILTSGYWPDRPDGAGLYRPFVIISYLIEHSLSGLDPLLYHIDNILLHFLCSFLLYLVLKPVFKDPRGAVISATIYAVHPVHVEAVAWVSGRSDLLSTLFLLVSFLFYQKRNHHKKAYVLLSCCSFFLALMSKESALILPPLLILYSVLFESSTESGRTYRLIKGISPYAAVFTVYLALRISAIGVLGPVEEERLLEGFSAFKIFLLMSEALFHYIRLGFFPFSLSADYNYQPSASLLDYKVIIPIVILALSLVFTKRIIRASSTAYFAIMWFIVCLLPVSNIIPIGIVMSERALYLPSMGICILLGLIFSSALGTDSHKSRVWMKPAVVVSVLVVTAMFAALSIQRNPVWKDRSSYDLELIRVCKNRIRNYPDHAPYYSKLAALYHKNGIRDDDAEKAAIAAVRMDYDNFASHYFMAIIHFDRGRIEEALKESEISLGLEENAEVYSLRGLIFYSIGEYAEADRMNEHAIRLKPEFGQYYLDRGYVRLRMGDTDTAYGLFEQAAVLSPENHLPFLEQGIILLEKGEFIKASHKLESAVKLNPSSSKSLYFLGLAYLNSGRTEMAKAALEDARKIEPSNLLIKDLLDKIP